MVWIKTVSPEEATGPVAELYQRSAAREGFVRETTMVFSLKPRMMQNMREFGAEMRNPEWKIAPTRREMLALVTSALSHCKY